MRGISFTKAVATGNDFIIIDRTGARGSKATGFSRLAVSLCDRKRGVGGDGLLVVAPSKIADFRMRVFNPDGTEAAMCGNGSRCIALFAYREKVVKRRDMTIETGAGILSARVSGKRVKVRLTDPRDIKWNFCLTIHACPYKVSFADTGVPHVVHFVEDIEAIDVKALGESMRYHEEFSPDGANADFVQIAGKDTIRVRTYERGVEDETLACGTGVVASAIIAAESEKLRSPVRVETRSGERLLVYFDLDEGRFSNVYLEGEASLVYKGETLVLGV